MPAIFTTLDSRPLDRFPAIRSRNSEKVREVLTSSFGARRFTVERTGPDLDAWINHRQSKAIGLSYCSYGARVEIDFPGADHYRQQFCIYGSADYRVGRTQRLITARETCVVPTDCALSVDFRPGFEQVVMRISAETVTAKLGAMLGGVARSELSFEPSIRLDTPLGASLRRAVTHFIAETDSGEMTKSPLALAELEQMLVTAFLCCNRSNYSARLESPERPLANHQLRRIEEYIEAHWSEPLTVETLSRAMSLSARSIFHHFKRSRGQSPMSFVKQIRLEHARRMLTRPDAQVSVTEVAFACGFGNLGHFGGDYFRRFGECPSETVRKARTAKR
jgi:AraC-like DNA-binding protein